MAITSISHVLRHSQITYVCDACVVMTTKAIYQTASQDRGIRFGPKVGQINTNWDKFETFSSKSYFSTFWRIFISPEFVPFGANLTQFVVNVDVSNLVSNLGQISDQFQYILAQTF